MLNDFSETDLELLETSLKKYHEASNDTDKISALASICENMMHEDWSKYQIFQYKLINDALKNYPSSHSITKSLKISLAGAINNIGYIHKQQGDIVKASEYYHNSLNIYKEIGDKQGIAISYNNIGSIYEHQGDINKALEYYYNSLNIYKEIGRKQGIADIYNNIGLVYEHQGDIPKALKCYLNNLKLYEDIGDKQGIAITYNNIGIIYNKQNDISKALEYYQNALKLYEDIGDKQSAANSYNNIGYIFKEQGDVVNALKYHNKSLTLREEIGDKQGMAYSYNNIGYIYRDQGNIKKALEYYYESLRNYEEIGDKQGIAMIYKNIGDLKFQHGDLLAAKRYGEKGLKLAKELGYPEFISSTSQLLSKVYRNAAKQGQALEGCQPLQLWSKALEMYELYIISRDSIESEKNQKEVIRQEYKYEYEKQAVADSIAFAKEKEISQAQITAQKAEIRAKRNQQYALYGGLFLVVVFSGFMYNRFKVTEKQKGVIEVQKEEVELAHNELSEKNKEILDSIAYAKRIQTAILPPSKLVKEYLSNSFILYKPKDIVAGDFYWMEHKDGKVLFAAADCTGHGVPGAMVSVICNNGLNRSVREYNLTDPGKILDKTREIVIQEFEKSEDEVKDGMDIALCTLDVSSSSGAYRELQYAGANNPLWIIRNNTTEIEEIKATKQPIGKYAEPQPYITHTIELQKGDSIYIFSDGYADQFGGEKGKKFKGANFKKLLLSIQHENMEKQKELINEAFENWRGKLEQIDDVCVIGVKV